MGSRDPVGRAAQCQVAPERKPRFVTCAIVDEVAEGLLFEWCVIIDLPSCILLYDGGRSCCAIVEKEIIAVHAVLRLVIDHQGFPYPCFSGGIDIQDLFGDFAPPHLVFDQEVARILRCQPVIGFPFCKPVDKVRLREVEYPVIKYGIELF